SQRLRSTHTYHISSPPLPALAPLYFFLLLTLRPPRSTLFPYTTLFRSTRLHQRCARRKRQAALRRAEHRGLRRAVVLDEGHGVRSEEHTSELQSRFDLVCRLLLEKKKKHIQTTHHTSNTHININ